jgi:hypothetical protein
VTDKRADRRDPWTAFGLGVFGGVIAGLTLLSFAGLQPLGVLAIVGAIVVRPRPFGSAGLLMGWGSTWLLLLWRANSSCDPSSCQNPDLIPWIAAGFILVGGGVALLAVAVRRIRRLMPG